MTKKLNYQFINQQIALEEFLKKFADSDFIAIDTEFIRKNTYYPILSLIQIADEHHAGVIDALSPNINITPLLDYLRHQDRQANIFHAARQDLEIFYMLMDGDLPKNIFDTQIAVQALGLGEQIGYAVLVKKYLDIDIDKSRQIVNWQQRPLHQKSLDYAACDVIYLAQIYPQIIKELKDKNRLKYVHYDMEILSDKSLYDSDHDKMWLKLKRIKNFNKRQHIIAQQITAWREKTAKEKNIPRSFILKDEAILSLLANTPKTIDDYKNVSSLPPQFSSHAFAKPLLHIIQQAKQIPLENAPILPKDNYRLNNQQTSLQHILNLLLQITAAREHISARLIVRNDELNQLIKHPDDRSNPLLQGWRFDMFGQQALKMIAGEIALTFQNGKITIINITDEK